MSLPSYTSNCIDEAMEAVLESYVDHWWRLYLKVKTPKLACNSRTKAAPELDQTGSLTRGLLSITRGHTGLCSAIRTVPLPLQQQLQPCSFPSVERVLPSGRRGG